MPTHNLVYRWTIACLFAVTMLIASTGDAQAQYLKTVVVLAGDEAPGTNGAVFNSVFNPKVISIAESGKVLFRAWLERDGVGVTAENDMGLWVYEADSLRLIARRGGSVPGLPGMMFRKDSQLGLEGNMDRGGKVSLDAFYSPDGTFVAEEHGFFMEEDGKMVLKVYQGLEVATGANLSTFDAGAFNNGRVVFYCLLEGDNVDNQSNRAYCQFGPEGVTVLARYREPMHLMSGSWTNQDVKQYNDTMPLAADGATIFQIVGTHPVIGAIGAVYRWSPDDGFELLRVSNTDSSVTRAFRNWRMDSYGFRMSTPLNQWPYKLSIFDHSDNLVATAGDIAPGSGSATFDFWVTGFAGIDTTRVAFSATLSDGKRGIWMGDQSDLRKVVRKDDWVPGETDSIQFGDIKYWMPNSRGQIAVANTMPSPPYFTYIAGIWMFAPDRRAEPITVRGELIDVAHGDTRTIRGIYTGMEYTTGMDEFPISSGFDGFPAKINNAGQLAFAVSFLKGGNALLIASPGKMLKMLDVNEDPLTNRKFVLSRVSNDVPRFTDTFIDTVESDSSGRIDISEYYTNDIGGTLEAGDSISLSKALHTVHSVKHSLLLGSTYNVVLDNAEFDSLGLMSYSELDMSAEQEVKMDHTTLAFNMVVSIEWDAGLAYIHSLEQGFRNMSNYLYDVSDGQMRLDTIAIYDNKDNWGFADLQIHASNMIHPHVDAIGGYYRQYGAASDPIEMPRKWFGKEMTQRQETFDEFPLDMSTARSYRTITHEFGHFGLNLKDEYKFVGGGSLCANRIHAGTYGLMDCQYVYCGIYSSELSSMATYASASCRNTYHWGLYQESTWETVESLFEETYADIEAPIIRPSERTLRAGSDYLPGPNLLHTGTHLVHHDVGALVEFPITHSAPSASNMVIRFIGPTIPGAGLDLNVDVTLADTTSTGSLGNIKQGKTSKDGGMRIVGKFPGHTIIATGYYHVLSGPKASRASSGRAWLYSDTKSEFPDSIVFDLREVQGDKAVISRVELLDRGLNYRLYAPNPFLSDPTVEHQPDGGVSTVQSFGSEAGGYSVSIPDSLAAFGTFRISAIDDSSAAYSFNADYISLEVDSGIVAPVKGPDGIAEVTLDNLDNSFEKAFLLSTDYPVLRTGLDPNAVQAGPAHNLAVFPEQPLTGDNSILIHYFDDDVVAGGGAFDLEESLRVFHWSATAQQWELIGGGVDTSHNEVTASITNAGVYAAFTTDTQTDVGDDPTETDDMLPEHFDVQQNFPNPFNPSTAISYSLPTRSDVSITVYNILGRRVRTLVEDNRPAGQHVVTWDGSDDTGSLVASGVYFYRITANGLTQSKKMILLK